MLQVGPAVCDMIETVYHIRPSTVSESLGAKPFGGVKSTPGNAVRARRIDNSHVPYLGAVQPKGSPNFPNQTHVTVISFGRARIIPV